MKIRCDVCLESAITEVCIETDRERKIFKNLDLCGEHLEFMKSIGLKKFKQFCKDFYVEEKPHGA